jgi:hypothetical protein
MCIPTVQPQDEDEDEELRMGMRMTIRDDVRMTMILGLIPLISILLVSIKIETWDTPGDMVSTVATHKNLPLSMCRKHCLLSFVGGGAQIRQLSQ